MSVEYVSFDHKYQSRIVELRQLLPGVDELIAEMSDVEVQRMTTVFVNRVARISELLAWEMDRREAALFGEEEKNFITPVPHHSEDKSVLVPYRQRAHDPYILNITRGGIVPSQAAQSVFYRNGVITVSGARIESSYDPNKNSIGVAIGDVKVPETATGRFLQGAVLAPFETFVATGGSVIKIYEKLREDYGAPQAVLVAACIAAKPGIEAILDTIPGSKVYAGVVRARLNDHGYVVDGAGDGGALTFGGRKGLLDEK